MRHTQDADRSAKLTNERITSTPREL